jgi:hypothetical protein
MIFSFHVHQSQLCAFLIILMLAKCSTHLISSDLMNIAHLMWNSNCEVHHQMFPYPPFASFFLCPTILFRALLLNAPFN